MSMTMTGTLLLPSAIADPPNVASCSWRSTPTHTRFTHTPVHAGFALQGLARARTHTHTHTHVHASVRACRFRDGRKTWATEWLTSATLQYVSTCASALSEQRAGTGGGRSGEHARDGAAAAAGDRRAPQAAVRAPPAAAAAARAHGKHLEEVGVAGRHAPCRRLQVQRDLPAARHALRYSRHATPSPALRPLTELGSWTRIFSHELGIGGNSSHVERRRCVRGEGCARGGARCPRRMSRRGAAGQRVQRGGAVATCRARHGQRVTIRLRESARDGRRARALPRRPWEQSRPPRGIPRRPGSLASARGR